MINFNGLTVPDGTNLLQNNRSFLYGDGVFETLKIVNQKIIFFEDHYFRLMASMRILRMEIPMNFTMEFIENQVLELAKVNNCVNSARVRFTIFRNDGGYYLPVTNEISYLISVSPILKTEYEIDRAAYEIELYKDFFVSKQLLSSIKSTNKIINVTGSIYAKENGYDNCLLLNESKNVVEALNGNLFMLLNNKIITPPISEGCLNGIMRKQVIEIAKGMTKLEILEDIISPFDLQKADELFITNVITGVQPITKYRKKEYGTALAENIVAELNVKVNL
jgi:branched-chain amino acid aminotransferase